MCMMCLMYVFVNLSLLRSGVVCSLFGASGQLSLDAVWPLTDRHVAKF